MSGIMAWILAKGRNVGGKVMGFASAQPILRATHPLYPGVVVREVNQTSTGTVINNYGEGTSTWQSPNTLLGKHSGLISMGFGLAKSLLPSRN